jgi:ubiquinol-cytochrome c reductase cytochrome c1 subunit
MLNAMPKTESKDWFGTAPPDLSLVARVRGPAWIYTYLKSFYADASRPFGANNLLFKEVAMPNILGPLSGKVILNTNATPSVSALVLIENGQMTPQQFDSALIDLVTFLDYVSEPNKWARHRLGVFVLIFLGVLWVLAFKLKQSYWQKFRKNPPKESVL